MGRNLADGSEARFAAYVEGLASVIGHADRVAPLEAYCIGLLLPGERKSVEPMAAITAPERVSAQHQSILHFISQGGWSDEKVLGKVRETARRSRPMRPSTRRCRMGAWSLGQESSKMRLGKGSRPPRRRTPKKTSSTVATSGATSAGLGCGQAEESGKDPNREG